MVQYLTKIWPMKYALSARRGFHVTCVRAESLASLLRLTRPPEPLG